MIRLIFCFSILFTNISFSQIEATSPEFKISKVVYNDLLATFKTLKIKEERVKVVTNKLGQVIAVTSTQPELMRLLKYKLVLPVLNANNELIPNEIDLTINEYSIGGLTIVDPKLDTIFGPLLTFSKLEILLKKQRYVEATNLFCERQRNQMNELQIKDEESFKSWMLMWTLDDSQLNNYVKKIIGGEAIQVLENGEWRICEK